MTTTISSESAAKKNVAKLQRAIVDGLEDIKAQDIQVFNTEHLSPLFERVIVASGTSNRQTKALAASVIDKVREAGFPKPRVEGEDNGEWIIVDCGAAVAHVMQPAIRQYYRLEELWGEMPVRLKLGAAKPVAAKKAPAKAAAGTAPAAKKATAKKAPAKKTAAAKTAAAQTAAAPKAPARRAAQSAAPSAAKPAAKRAPKPAAGAQAKPAAKAPARKAASTTARKTAAPRAGSTAVQKLVVSPRKAAAPAKTGAAAKAPARKAPARKSAAPR
ncbi:MAG: ribosome silencing factor [Burkholderiales bacterium 68-12]|nr:MAG: ribosome silencing factor [Burkholderiales bacterium 68-12]